MSLLQFLKDNPIDEEVKTFKIRLDGRLADAEPFEVHTMSRAEYKDLQKMATKNNKLQTEKLATSVLVKCCVNPKFNDIELIKDLKVATPEGAAEKLLTQGEISAISLQIIELSGLNVSAEVLEEEVKN